MRVRSSEEGTRVRA